MRRLPSAFYKSLSLSKTRQNMCARENNYRSSKRAGQTPAHLLRESILCKELYTSPSAIVWLMRESRRLGKHIHHATCGNGGERLIVRAPVDGYEPTARTVFQYHGCHWHGCSRCCTYNQEKIVSHNQTRRSISGESQTHQSAPSGGVHCH